MPGCSDCKVSGARESLVGEAMAQQLFRLHKGLQHLERQTWQLQAMWKHLAPDLTVALQAGVAAPARNCNQFSTLPVRTLTSSSNGFAAWESLVVQHHQQSSLQMLRRFTSSPTLKAAAEETGAAAKEAGKDEAIPKAAASSEAASTSGEQAATVAMRKGRMSGVSIESSAANQTTRDAH